MFSLLHEMRKFDKNAKVQQLTKVVLSHGEEKGLIVKDPFCLIGQRFMHIVMGSFTEIRVYRFETRRFALKSS